MRALRRKCTTILLPAALLTAASAVALAGAASPGTSGAPGILETILHNPVASVFAIIGLGMLLGSVHIHGVTLGSSGVIFVAIAFGALGAQLPAQLGNFGLVLFVYCVGLTAGPGFFRAFARQGADLAKLSVLIVATGAAVTAGFAWAAGVKPALAAGVFAGALTSTPGLAAALDVAGHDPAASIGYGIAYPFGVVGVVLFVQLLPRLLRRDLEEEARQCATSEGGPRTIHRALIEVKNPSVFGRKMEDVHFVQASHCQVPRVWRGERLVPVTSETVFEQGQLVLAVGDEDHLQDLADFLGARSDRPYLLDVESQRMKVVATSPEVIGKKLRELKLIHRFGVTISRIDRNDVGFVPDSDTAIHRADILYAVGEPDQLKQFAAFAGHRTRVLDETDLISLSAGIVVGVLVGMAPIGLGGGGSFTLGLAGGPLLVALLLGHFGGVGRLRGHMPRAARLLMTEVGLVFFLAHAGAKAGADFAPVFREHGAVLLAMGAVVTIAPMAVGYLYARHVLKLNLLQTLGGACGSMTSTPGLGAITAKTDSEAPTVSYATAYPVALILMTVFAKLIIQVLG